MASSQMVLTNNRVSNTRGVAYEFKYHNRILNQMLVVREIATKTRSDHAFEKSLIRAPDVHPTEAELSFKDDLIIGLWVGIRFLVDYDFGLPPAQDGSGADQYLGGRTIEHDSDILRVIARTCGANTNYYCLANQKGGLCTAYRISIKEIFFFDEYRDDTVTTTWRRKAAWSEIVGTAYKVQKEILQPKDSEPTLQSSGTQVHDEDTNTDASPFATGTNNGVTEETQPVRGEQRTGLYKLATSNEVLSLPECEQVIQELYVSIESLAEGYILT